MHIRTMKKTGFTLIELLVVIAIIGILAGLLFPAISGGIAKANMTRMANNGKQITTAIVSANFEREAVNESQLWPTSDSDEQEEQDMTYSKSHEYFAALMGADDDDDEPKIVGITHNMFAGGGIRAADDLDSFDGNGRYCAWNCTQDFDEGKAATMFMFTKNLDLADGDIQGDTITAGDGDQDWREKLVNKAPIKEAGAVVITVGCSAHVYPKAQLKSAFTVLNGETKSLEEAKVLKTE